MDSSVWMWILLVSPNPTPTQPIRPTSTPNYPLTSQQFSLTKARRINTTKVLLCLTDTSLYQSNTTKVLLCLTDTSLYIYTCVKHFGMAKIKKKNLLPSFQDTEVCGVGVALASQVRVPTMLLLI